jgi:two-component system, NarL family, sensor kinase
MQMRVTAPVELPERIPPVTTVRAQRFGLVLSGACVVLSLAGFVLAAGPGGRPLSGLLHDNVLNNLVNGVTLGVLAGVLVLLRPANRLGWLVLAIAWCNALAIGGEGWALASYHVDLPGRTLSAWLAAWPWAPALLLGSSLLPLLYPTGRTASRFAHRLAVAAVTAAGAVAVALALLDATFTDSVPGHHLGPNPLSQGHLQTPLVVLAAAGAVVALLVAVLAWGHTLRRLWRARSPEREQLAWLLAMVVPVAVTAPLNTPWVSFTVQAFTPVGLVVGIVWHQLFDIKPVLRSGLVFGTLTAVAVGAYFGMVALITTVTPAGTMPSLFAAAAVALVVVPAHRWLQRGVGRLVYGDRHDPVGAMVRVTAGIGQAAAGSPDLAPMLTGLAQALRSPHVDVRAADGSVLAEVGEPAADHPRHRVALDYAGERVGELSVAGRTAHNPLTGADRRLVAALAGPVAAAVRAAVLARQVSDSRSRVLAVRESERRRLRADLHDGLGPSLSGVALGLEAARTSLATHPQRAGEILDVLHREVDSLVAEVRGIIDDLGPGGVDLMASLRGHVEAARVGAGIVVELCENGPVDVLPGEVAVAAQRIAGEALTNAVRHAGAARITVSIRRSGEELVVEVADDGCGDLVPRPGGVGLASMHERAESVGGVLSIDAVPGRGTRVVAVLPVQARVEESA